MSYGEIVNHTFVLFFFFFFLLHKYKLRNKEVTETHSSIPAWRTQWTVELGGL